MNSVSAAKPNHYERKIKIIRRFLEKEPTIVVDCNNEYLKLMEYLGERPVVFEQGECEAALIERIFEVFTSKKMLYLNNCSRLTLISNIIERCTPSEILIECKSKTTETKMTCSYFCFD